MAVGIIEPELVRFLESLRTPVENRWHEDELPAAAELPAGVYQVISREQERDLGGPIGLFHPRIQLTIWARTGQEARAIGATVREALDPRSPADRKFIGQQGAFEVQYVAVENEESALEDSVAAANRAARGVRMDVIVWFS